MKVKMITKKENNGMRIACRVEGGEEMSLIKEFIKSNRQMGKMLSEIKKVNDLGRYLYNVFNEVENEFLIGRSIIAPENLVNGKNVKEIADFVTRYLADVLEKAVNLPELYETIATVEVPEDLKKRLSEYGVDFNFRIDFVIEKEPGFNTVFVRRIINIDNSLHSLISNLPYDLFKVSFECITGNKEDIINLFARYKGNVLISVDQYVDKGLEKLKQEIKSCVKRETENILKNLNLLLAAIYHPLNYKAGPIRIFDGADKELNEYVISKIEVQRESIFSDINVNLTINTPALNSVYRDKRCSIVLDILGRSMGMEMYMGNGQMIHTFIYEDTSARIKRVLEGDVSVVKEVEDFDRAVVSMLPDLLKGKIIECLVDNDVVLKTPNGGYKLNDVFKMSSLENSNSPEIEYEREVVEAMSEEGKKKLITLLVAQKIKNSIEGD